MKLYATVTSERATKGQGGNEYIDIHITDAQKHTMWCINVSPSGFMRVTVPSEIPNRSSTVFEGFTKGEKQKGEKLCPKYNDIVLPDENGKCSLCGLHNA